MIATLKRIPVPDQVLRAVRGSDIACRYGLQGSIPCRRYGVHFRPADPGTMAGAVLVAGSTLAGSLTLFGSVATPITVKAAAEGYPVTFWRYRRFGLPLT